MEYFRTYRRLLPSLLILLGLSVLWPIWEHNHAPQFSTLPEVASVELFEAEVPSTGTVWEFSSAFGTPAVSTLPTDFYPHTPEKVVWVLKHREQLFLQIKTTLSRQLAYYHHSISSEEDALRCA